jgi:hypothetical protein
VRLYYELFRDVGDRPKFGPLVVRFNDRADGKTIFYKLPLELSRFHAVVLKSRRRAKLVHDAQTGPERLEEVFGTAHRAQAGIVIAEATSGAGPAITATSRRPAAQPILPGTCCCRTKTDNLTT